MKCTKCGYVSFDYLSECRKCGANLLQVRDGLGFGSAKPAVPSFLAGMLEDNAIPAAKDEGDSRPEKGEPTLDFGEEFAVPDLDEARDDDSTAAFAQQADGHLSERRERGEFNLVDLSDVELDLSIDDGAEVEVEPKLDIAPELDGDLKLDLDPQLDAELELEPQLETEWDSERGEEGKSSGSAEDQSALPGNEPLVVELSENELEDLLSELEKSSPKGAEN